MDDVSNAAEVAEKREDIAASTEECEVLADLPPLPAVIPKDEVVLKHEREEELELDAETKFVPLDEVALKRRNSQSEEKDEATPPIRDDAVVEAVEKNLEAVKLELENENGYGQNQAGISYKTLFTSDCFRVWLIHFSYFFLSIA